MGTGKKSSMTKNCRYNLISNRLSKQQQKMRSFKLTYGQVLRYDNMD